MRPTSYTIFCHGLGNVHSAEDPATLPLPTGACTGLLSEGVLLAIILHKNARPHLGATNWAPVSSPCQLALVLPLWQHWLHSPRTRVTWRPFPRKLSIRMQSLVSPQGKLLFAPTVHLLAWCDWQLLFYLKISDSLRLWEHTGLGESRRRTLSL